LRHPPYVCTQRINVRPQPVRPPDRQNSKTQAHVGASAGDP